MNQRERVLSMLKKAGAEGVRSDTFYAAYLPRPGARIFELRQEGYEITAERERQFVRYKLVGVGAEARQPQGAGLSGFITGERQPASADPGEPAPTLFELPKAASAYDPFSEAA